jgi:hypothetical protein
MNTELLKELKVNEDVIVSELVHFKVINEIPSKLSKYDCLRFSRTIGLYYGLPAHKAYLLYRWMKVEEGHISEDEFARSKKTVAYFILEFYGNDYKIIFAYIILFYLYVLHKM